jgi:2-haloacid dehalogenase
MTNPPCARGLPIRRPGNEVLSVGPQPTFVGADLNDVANQLIARFAAPAG